MPNGQLTNVLLWMVTGLLGLVSALIGFIVHTHIKADDDAKKYFLEEIKLLRQRMHDALNDITELRAVIHMRKEDRK